MLALPFTATTNYLLITRTIANTAAPKQWSTAHRDALATRGEDPRIVGPHDGGEDRARGAAEVPQGRGRQPLPGVQRPRQEVPLVAGRCQGEFRNLSLTFRPTCEGLEDMRWACSGRAGREIEGSEVMEKDGMLTFDNCFRCDR